jgi:hypothetical protein
MMRVRFFDPCWGTGGLIFDSHRRTTTCTKPGYVHLRSCRQNARKLAQLVHDGSVGGRLTLLVRQGLQALQNPTRPAATVGDRHEHTAQRCGHRNGCRKQPLQDVASLLQVLMMVLSN